MKTTAICIALVLIMGSVAWGEESAVDFDLGDIDTLPPISEGIKVNLFGYICYPVLYNEYITLNEIHEILERCREFIHDPDIDLLGYSITHPIYHPITRRSVVNDEIAGLENDIKRLDREKQLRADIDRVLSVLKAHLYD